MKKFSEKSKIAVIGIGGWGKNHVRVLSEMGVLAAICDADVDRLKNMSEKYKIENYFTSTKDLLDSKIKLDGCLVCTPTKTHYKIASELMENKINVFVEKPLSYSYKECQEMIKIAEKNKVILTTGYIERFNPAVKEVKRIISENKYGNLIMLEFHRENRMPLHIKDVGIIYDTSVHDIDTAMHLFGKRPNLIFARAGKMFHSNEDFATIILGFDEQRVAVISSNWITPKKVRRFSAVCTDGIINGDFISQEIVIDTASETILTPRKEKIEPLTLELESFIETINGYRKEPVVSSLDAADVTRVAESAILSATTGAPIYLEWDNKN